MSDNKDLAINKQFITELLNDACFIIDQAQEIAYRQVNEVLIKRNWLSCNKQAHPSKVFEDRIALSP